MNERSTYGAFLLENDFSYKNKYRAIKRNLSFNEEREEGRVFERKLFCIASSCDSPD